MFYTLHTEQLHLERIHLVNTDLTLQADVSNVHSAYASYGTFCLHQGATFVSFYAAIVASQQASDSPGTTSYIYSPVS